MLIILCWILLAAIHVFPAFTVFQPALLTKLYGVEAGSILFLLLHDNAAGRQRCPALQWLIE
jgi:zinc transporter ZupT